MLSSLSDALSASTKPPKHQDSCHYSPCQATTHHNSPCILTPTPSVYRPIGNRHNAETIPHPAKKASGLHPFRNPCPSTSVQTSTTCIVPRETQRALGSSVKRQAENSQAPRPVWSPVPNQKVGRMKKWSSGWNGLDARVMYNT